MKKVGLLATTAFASTLLFTGINANETNAAENELSDSQIEDIANNYLNSNNIDLAEGTNITIAPDHYTSPEGYTNVVYAEDGGNGPSDIQSSIYVNNVTGEVLDYNAENHKPNNDTEEMANPEGQQQTPSAEQNVDAQANNTGAEATNEAASAPQQEEANQEQAMLPETGGEASNSTMITIIASLFIAAGSFLTFKRRSKQK